MITIRQYQDADAAAVWDLHNAALVPTGAHAGNGAWDEDLQHVREVYLDGDGEFLVGVLDGRIVAMGALLRTSATRGKITRMRVHPDHQRQGLGQSILNALERRGRELGLESLHLDTTTLQKAAQALYRKNGYRQVGSETWGRFDVLRFEKPLGRKP